MLKIPMTAFLPPAAKSLQAKKNHNFMVKYKPEYSCTLATSILSFPQNQLSRAAKQPPFRKTMMLLLSKLTLSFNF